MQTKFSIIQPNGTVEVKTEDMPTDPGFHGLTKVLGPIFQGQREGAHFEHVSILGVDGYRRDMFVDEKGAIFKMPVNMEATKHYHRAAIANGITAKHSDGIIPDGNMIHGLAVIFDRRVWF